MKQPWVLEGYKVYPSGQTVVDNAKRLTGAHMINTYRSTTLLVPLLLPNRDLPKHWVRYRITIDIDLYDRQEGRDVSKMYISWNMMHDVHDVQDSMFGIIWLLHRDGGYTYRPVEP